MRYHFEQVVDKSRNTLNTIIDFRLNAAVFNNGDGSKWNLGGYMMTLVDLTDVGFTAFASFPCEAATRCTILYFSM